MSRQSCILLILLKSVIPPPSPLRGIVVLTLDEGIYDSHLLLMMSSWVLELPAKNFPISSKRSRVVTLEFYGGFTRYSGHFREPFVDFVGG